MYASSNCRLLVNPLLPKRYSVNFAELIDFGTNVVLDTRACIPLALCLSWSFFFSSSGNRLANVPSFDQAVK